MNTPAGPLPMSTGQRETLQALARSQASPHRLVIRAKALLLAADGVANAHVATGGGGVGADGSAVADPVRRPGFDRVRQGRRGSWP